MGTTLLVDTTFFHSDFLRMEIFYPKLVDDTHYSRMHMDSGQGSINEQFASYGVQDTGKFLILAQYGHSWCSVSQSQRIMGYYE